MFKKSIAKLPEGGGRFETTKNWSSNISLECRLKNCRCPKMHIGEATEAMKEFWDLVSLWEGWCLWARWYRGVHEHFTIVIHAFLKAWNGWGFKHISWYLECTVCFSSLLIYDRTFLWQFLGYSSVSITFACGRVHFGLLTTWMSCYCGYENKREDEERRLIKCRAL